jgi:alpha-mannosidase
MKVGLLLRALQLEKDNGVAQAQNEVWTVFVIPSSHNDIGWAGTPAEIADHRAQIIDAALEGMEQHPDYRFVMEAGLYFREYLDRRPQRAPLLKRYIDEGRFEWGGSYVQAYEGILTDEGLLRQLYLGRGWLLREYGINARSYWHIDVVARTLQLPQILSHAGFQYLVLSRNKPGLYWWEAPDGSRMLTFSYWEGAYGRSKVFDTLKRHYSPLESRPAYGEGQNLTVSQLRRDLNELIDQWQEQLRACDLPCALAVTMGADYVLPDISVIHLVEQFNAQPAGAHRQIVLRIGTVQDYINWLARRCSFARLPVVKGEVPNPWVYIHQPGHNTILSSMRQAENLLVGAEMLHCLLALQRQSWELYPQQLLQRAWADTLYPDHGYGGLHGEGTDAVFKERVDRGRFQAQELMQSGLKAIAEEAPVLAGSPGRFAVFNPCSWPVTDWVEIEIPIAEKAAGLLGVEDESGVRLECQVLRQPGPGRAGVWRIGFIARAIPATGYRIFHLVENSPEHLSSREEQEIARAASEDFVWEHQRCFARVTRGGLAELVIDGQRVLSSDYYFGGEVIQLESPGVDVGTHEHDPVYSWQIVRPFQPVVQGEARPVAENMELVEQGPLRWVVAVYARHRQCQIVERYIFYKDLQRIDIEIEVRGWNGEHSRELRWALPLAERAESISYGVPFGAATVGQAETEEFRDSRPREILRWISARLSRATVTLTTPVMVADWEDPTDRHPGTMLQLVLLASKRSIHRRGNWYSQEGTHTFRAAIHLAPQTTTAMQRAGRATHSLIAGPMSHTSRVGSKQAPWQMLLSIEPQEVMITAIKKHEDSNALVVRLVEMQGKATTARVTLPVCIASASLFDGLELRPIEALRGDHDNDVRVRLQPHALATVLIHLAPVNERKQVL